MSEAWDHPPPPREAVEAWLDRIRPALVADGGNLELISVEHDGTVHIALATPDGTGAINSHNAVDRETFKFITSQQALDLLRQEIT